MTDTNNQDNEYKQLYDEIGRNSVISQNVFIANVAVTASLIGYGLSSESGSIFLAPFAIIIPSLFFLASQLESTTRIACYIIVYLESNNRNINWENRWFNLRDKNLIPSKRKYTLSLSGLYGLLGIVCLLLSFRYWEYDKCIFFYISSPIVLLHIRGVTMIIRAFSLKLCKAYIEAWQKLDT